MAFVVFGFTAVVTADGDGLEPNFANRMLTPYLGSHFAPRLVPTRHHFPLKVVMINDGLYFSEHSYEIVKEACQAWTEATKNVPQGGVTLTCEAASEAKGADVIIRFGTLKQTNGYEGFTSEFGPYALIQLSTKDRFGDNVSDFKLRRVAMHEFGHALGIWGHSPNASDIMSLDEKTSSVSVADVNTLLLAYSSESNSERRYEPWIDPCTRYRCWREFWDLACSSMTNSLKFSMVSIPTSFSLSMTRMGDGSACGNISKANSRGASRLVYL